MAQCSGYGGYRKMTEFNQRQAWLLLGWVTAERSGRNSYQNAENINTIRNRRSVLLLARFQRQSDVRDSVNSARPAAQPAVFVIALTCTFWSRFSRIASHIHLGNQMHFILV
ncbi:hypothetical protein J6590_020815 [Homalodisca vitripennis]|nr:hypothetical protein J6590_020815 [Homalodisca vitripennis]